MKHDRRRRRQVKPLRIVMAAAALIVLAAVIVAVGRRNDPPAVVGPPPGTLPHAPATYLGVYADRVPASYGGVAAFANATGVAPDVVMCSTAHSDRAIPRQPHRDRGRQV